MAIIQISADSDLPADKILAAITDFTPRRPTLWPNLDPGIYEVHEVGADWALVTEGTNVAGGVWARERYDWSVPGVVRATVQDSNIFKSGFWEMKVASDGTRTHIEIHQDRQAKGFKGHLMGVAMALIGRRVYRQDLAKVLANLRDDQGSPQAI